MQTGEVVIDLSQVQDIDQIEVVQSDGVSVRQTFP
jgi:hypothetical protein